MKIVKLYQCEICSMRHNTQEAAERCESKGRPIGPPIGMIFGDSRKGQFYAGMTFAVGDVKRCTNPHFNDVRLWACRDYGVGDTLGSEFCSATACSDGWPAKGYDIPDPRHPTFKRMESFLSARKIPITVWNGVKAVPLEKFLKHYRRVR